MTKLLLLLLSIPRASAQIIDETVNIRDPSLTDVGLILLSTTRWVLGIAGGIAIVIILFGAGQYVTAYLQGKEKMEGGKKTILYGIIGLVVILFAYIGISFFVSVLTTDF